MIDEMKALLQAKTMCVFATVSGGQPHCSLMAYAAGEGGTEIYLATLRTTRKFRNVAENPAVSLLVDTREELPRDRARALTVEGVCRPIASGPERERARSRLAAVHPHLGALLYDPDCEILSVRITSFLLLKGITEAHKIDL
jgi:nitroimidazol reductase NimA-like FMN-containing flavoprotein (pyridoxamine 5'-phosphate oxidase superfamily)